MSEPVSLAEVAVRERLKIAERLTALAKRIARGEIDADSYLVAVGFQDLGLVRWYGVKTWGHWHDLVGLLHDERNRQMFGGGPSDLSPAQRRKRIEQQQADETRAFAEVHPWLCSCKARFATERGALQHKRILEARRDDQDFHTSHNSRIEIPKREAEITLLTPTGTEPA